MAYRPLSAAEAEQVNAWLDVQAFCDIVRQQAWDLFDFNAQRDHRSTYSVFAEMSPDMARRPQSANDAVVELPAEQEAYIQTLPDKDQVFMRSFFSSAGDSLQVWDAYDIYFGPVDALTPQLRHKRMAFLSCQSVREETLAYQVENGLVHNPHDLDEVKTFFRSVAQGESARY